MTKDARYILRTCYRLESSIRVGFRYLLGALRKHLSRLRVLTILKSVRQPWLRFQHFRFEGLCKSGNICWSRDFVATTLPMRAQ